IAAIVRDLVAGIGRLLGVEALSNDAVEVDDAFVGEGYGLPTEASMEAIRLAAASDGLLLDPVYTAKAMAGLIARVRAGVFDRSQTVLFWHTGGLPALFA
ncbi:MAG TPA: pyridoxal-phosphate dependent enzyme, partial [Gammaproteobacteria bacterium]|nr:pyridoxal-phosphate dependent enzyme [Gammaproteobacteria bacterium]